MALSESQEHAVPGNASPSTLDWLETVYASVDGQDVDTFVEHFRGDGRVIFGNNPPAEGPEAIHEAIGGFFDTLDDLEHAPLSVLEVDDTVVFEAHVTYTRLDGGTVQVPATTVIERDQGLVDEMRIYVDVAPLYE